jgi:hypothetical protein
MANITIREYADVAHTIGKVVQAGAEPCNTTQAVASSAAHAESAAFGVNTRLVAIATVAASALAVEFGLAPVATALGSLRLPANSVTYFGVRPGDKVSIIDAA